MTPNEVISFLEKLGIYDDDSAYDIIHRIRTLDNAPKCRVHSGASKICIDFIDCPFVVKWSTDGYDEASAEVAIYQEAINEGLQRFFPATTSLCEIKGIHFVVQQKVDFSVSQIPDHKASRYSYTARTAKNSLTKKMEREFNKGSDGCGRRLDTLWAKMVLVLYGKRVAQHLCHFIQENGINDLHCDNIGYKNDRPIILDFSGYHRGSDY